MSKSQQDILSKQIIGAAIEVHRVLGGPGLLEDVYEEALCEELRIQGIEVKRQVAVAINYQGKVLSKRLVIDLVVGGSVIVEVKATVEQNPIYQSQLLTYLRLSDNRLGLLINFGQPLLKDGIHRVVNNL